jgi:hypothetical protein
MVETEGGRDVAVVIRTSRTVQPGHARVQAGTPGFAPGRTGWVAARVRADESAQATGTVSANAGEA